MKDVTMITGEVQWSASCGHRSHAAMRSPPAARHASISSPAKTVLEDTNESDIYHHNRYLSYELVRLIISVRAL